MLGAIGYGVDNSNNSNIRNGLLANTTSNVNISEKYNKNTVSNDNTVTTVFKNSSSSDNTSAATTENTSRLNNTSDTKSYTVYITKTGKKYHRSGCKYLSISCISISSTEAISDGYTPCSVCNP